MCAESLRFTPGAKQSGQLIRQLCSVLEQRREPLKLRLDMRKGPAAPELSVLLVDAAATSRPAGVDANALTCCVEELYV